MRRITDGLAIVDVYLLLAMHYTILFLIEWFSFSRKWIERAMIGVFATLWFAQPFPFSYSWKFFFGAINIAWFWSLHRKSDKQRIIYMISWPFIGLRLTYLALHVLDCFGKIGLLWAVQDLLFVVIIYATSIPGGGDPGRRRKLALDKLKELFGTSWISRPIPMPT